MKSGLLLVQSIASSTLRCLRSSTSSGGHRQCLLLRSSSSLALSHHVHNRRLASRLVRADSSLVIGRALSSVGGNNSHRGRIKSVTSSAVFGIACAASLSTTAIAMCSSDDSSTAKSSTVDEHTTRIESIDDPLVRPEHHASCPFPEEVLQHDTYNGITLNLSKLVELNNSNPNDTTTNTLSDPQQFQTILHKALQIWHTQSRRGIWLRIPTTHSHLIPPATSLGFDFRHAEPGNCVLTKWLPADASFGGEKSEKEKLSRLPNGPTHQVGVGVLVLHPRTGKMLVVREKSGPAAARKLWKMPTGLTDPGEDIATAAIRELKEETGLDCIFDRIICFRQAHGGLFNRSDMFFVCLCKLAPQYDRLVQEGKEIELHPQEEEILCADWIDMEDYSNQSVWRESPLYKEMNGAMLRAAKRGIEYSGGTDDGLKDGSDDQSEIDDEIHGFVAKNLPVGFRPGSNTIYVSSKL